LDVVLLSIKVHKNVAFPLKIKIFRAWDSPSTPSTSQVIALLNEIIATCLYSTLYTVQCKFVIEQKCLGQLANLCQRILQNIVLTVNSYS